MPVTDDPRLALFECPGSSMLDVFDHPVIARCQLHKIRNAVGLLQLRAGGVGHREEAVCFDIDQSRAAQQSRQRPSVGQVHTSLRHQGAESVFELVGHVMLGAVFVGADEG